MRKEKVVVRNLSALEALGGVTNICSDKTGTLTQGKMIVKKLWIPEIGTFTVDSSEPKDPTAGKVLHEAATHSQPTTNVSAPNQNNVQFDLPQTSSRQDSVPQGEVVEIPSPELANILYPIALCNLATVKHEPQPQPDSSEEWKTTGEPTEVALQVFAHRFEGFGKDSLIADGWKQAGEFPFDSTIKRMSVVYNHQDLQNSKVYTKGAVETVLALCTNIKIGDKLSDITDDLKAEIMEKMNKLADEGFRVLGIAMRDFDGQYHKEETETQRAITEVVRRSRSDKEAAIEVQKSKIDEDTKREIDALSPLRQEEEIAHRCSIETNLSFLGLAAIYDPPRDETKDAIQACYEARILVHMLTVGFASHAIFAGTLANKVNREIISQLPERLLGKLV